MTAPLADFAVRTTSAALLGAVMLVAIVFGGVWGVAILVSAIGVLVAAEFYTLTRRERRTPNEVFGLTAVFALPLATARYGSAGLATTVSVLIVAALVWHVAIRSVRLSDTAVTVFGVAYIGFTLAHLVLMRQLAGGVALCLLLVFGVWANDVFAYLAGSSIGRTPLAPRISPRKTWEGFAAGTLATTLVWVVGGSYLTSMAWPSLVFVGLSASAAAALGDLAESRFKREVMVKDSGTLLPGHGGFLDRFDSFILVTVVAYYTLTLVGVR
ncbi:MAG: phosphatidate cytidylyltransferase [Coriobacteriia bacterium]|nr:phosphatidate cytidylyltransferase [Actinomycetota bacterium]MDZ4167652.1 phosphatidate cytidylyltransferase [Coriobacteriia bacterium]